MAIHWDAERIRRHMEKRGIQNASQLAAFARIGKPTAGRIIAGERIERIDADVIEAVARALELTPGALIVQAPGVSAPTV